MLSAMILGADLAEKSGMSSYTAAAFMVFPLALHSLDILASTIGMAFIKTKPGLPFYDASYGEMEDSLEVMKRGFKVAVASGVVGFLVLARLFLEFNGSWINFAGCGLAGIAVSYIFILSTQYYTDYNYGPV